MKIIIGQSLFIGLVIYCLNIFLYYFNPFKLIVWSITGDGLIFDFCIGILQIFFCVLVLQIFWRYFRNYFFWAIVFSIVLPVLLALIPFSVTDIDIRSFFTPFEDFNNYGTVSLLFVLFLLEIMGVVIYCVLSKITRKNGNVISLWLTRCFLLFDFLAFLGGIVYLKHFNNGEGKDGQIMMTPDGKYYLCEYRTADSIHVVISDNDSFTDRLAFGANKTEKTLLVQLYPNNIVVIDCPDSLICVESLSKYSLLFKKEPNMDAFLTNGENKYSCYYFWFNLPNKPLSAQYFEYSSIGRCKKIKKIYMRSTKTYYFKQK